MSPGINIKMPEDRRGGSGSTTSLESHNNYHGGGGGRVLKHANGGLYEERVKSFINQDWPYADPTKHTCTAEELSLAGFMWCGSKHPDGEPFGKCFACDVEIIVHDFGPETDPWYLHQERNPNCPYIKLGKKKFPQDYKFREIYNIIGKKRSLRWGLLLSDIENATKLGILNADSEGNEVDK